MYISQVTVEWQETASLPGYNNIRPSIGMTAQLDANEDAFLAIGALLAEVKALVQEEIDATLIARGYSPRFTPSEDIGELWRDELPADDDDEADDEE